MYQYLNVNPASINPRVYRDFLITFHCCLNHQLHKQAMTLKTPTHESGCPGTLETYKTYRIQQRESSSASTSPPPPPPPRTHTLPALQAFSRHALHLPNLTNCLLAFLFSRILTLFSKLKQVLLQLIKF